jgi:hypothetical protein
MLALFWCRHGDERFAGPHAGSGDGGAGRLVEGSAGRRTMIVAPPKDEGGGNGRTTPNESAARSAAHELAVLDDDDAQGGDSLSVGFSVGGLLGRGRSATADDNSTAKIGLVHGRFHAGHGAYGL